MNTNGNSNKDVFTSLLGKVMKEVISIATRKKGYNIRYKVCGVEYRMISDFQRLYATVGENNPSLCAEDPRSGILCELYKILRLNI